MENSQIKLLGSYNGLSIKNQPGRLVHEIQKNKTDVLVILISGIVKAHEVLNITPGSGEKIKKTAEEAIKKILEVYPGAMVADIVKALEMGSFGQIKQAEQLTTISAANIYNWYKIFRADYGHLMSSPNEKIPTQMPEPSEEEKKMIVKKAFDDFIFDPVKNELATDIYYQKLIDLGVWNPTVEQRIQAYNKQADYYTGDRKIPIEFLTDSVKRGQCFEFIEYWNDRKEGQPYQFEMWKDNPLSILCSRNAKKEMVREFLKQSDKAKLIQIHNAYIGI